MQSLKSTALEPTRAELATLPTPQRIMRLLPVYGLPILTILLIVVFSFILPETFPTMLNLRSILGDKAIIAILSLAAMIPMMAGRIDLTVGYGIVLWHILAIALQTKYGIDWPIAVLLVLVLGCLLGLLNGLLVEYAQIDSSSPPSGRAPSSMPSPSGTPTGDRSSACCHVASPICTCGSHSASLPRHFMSSA